MASAARRSRGTSGALALTALAALFSPARPARADGWSLLGYAAAPGFVEPIGPGKALVCSSRRCAVWDVTTASSTPTEGTLWWSGQVAHAPLRDGSVIIVDGSNNRPARIWSPSTGRWRDAATLPEMLGQPQIATLADGRIILAGEDWAARRPRAYVADANVRAWTLLAEAPTEPLASHVVPKLLPVPSGLVLLSYNAGETPISRFSAATKRWEAVTVDGWTEEHKLLTTVWGDDVVVFARRDQGWDAILVGPGGQKRQALPEGLNDGVVPENISAAAGAQMLFLQGVGKNGKRYVWRRADETPREIVSAAGASIYSPAAVDDRHVVGLMAFAVRLLTLDDQPNRERPCDGVERFLRDGFGTGPVTKAADPSLPAGFDLTLVSDACREQVQRGEAPQLLALVRGWTARPQAVWRDLGRTLSCAIQDPGALPAIPGWFSGRGPRVTRSICITELDQLAERGGGPPQGVREAGHVRRIWMGPGGGAAERALFESLARPSRRAPPGPARGAASVRPTRKAPGRGRRGALPPDLRRGRRGVQRAANGLRPRAIRWLPGFSTSREAPGARHRRHAGGGGICRRDLRCAELGLGAHDGHRARERSAERPWVLSPGQPSPFRTQAPSSKKADPTTGWLRCSSAPPSRGASSAASPPTTRPLLRQRARPWLGSGLPSPTSGSWWPTDSSAARPRLLGRRVAGRRRITGGRRRRVTRGGGCCG